MIYDQNGAEFQDDGLLVVKKTITAEAFRRELRRKKQLQYRKKKHAYVVNLDKGNQALRREVAALKQRHSSLLIPAPSLWSTATLYFNFLRDSLYSPAEATTQPVSTFLNDHMNIDDALKSASVVFNSDYGFKAMIQSLNRISHSFGRPAFELKRCEEISSNSLEATSTISLTITGKTLSDVFPHLFPMRASTRFELDTNHTRVTTMVTKSDFMSPMLGLLGSLEDVRRVSERAQISPDLQWKSSTISE
ncbi:hypothetical protein F444_09008 [Phytophthora nicotianae P1976]|uniref:Uncharacterized protein n=1 Tax=Phytophthora nicotianae P1976 TaxID=1317066 RepID=A0A081A905_PHYNI|nr:hypothetical protein F444_09008 [Phytophthora nicotianae P1976]